MIKKAIQIDSNDNVATTTSHVVAGEQIDVLNPNGDVIHEIIPIENINFGHKIALKNFEINYEIIKYGEIIGGASKPIKLGDWVHTHNVNSARMHTSGENVRGITS